MNRNKQMHAPVYEALERLKRRRVVPFDVPGHKRGRGNPELADLLGEKCVSLDVNSMKPLDNLCHPVSVIRKQKNWQRKHFVRIMPFLWLAEQLLPCREWCFPAARQVTRSFCREMYIKV